MRNRSGLHAALERLVRDELDLRAEQLRRRLTETSAVLTASVEHGAPRLHLLEHEYVSAVVSAELDWVRSVSEDIDAGNLSWKAYF